MGDRSVDVKFIFTGIGKSLDELFGADQSSFRQFEQVELPRLGCDATARSFRLLPTPSRSNSTTTSQLG